MLHYVSLKISWIWALTSFENDITLQQDTTNIYHHVIKNFDALIRQDDMSSEYTLNGQPVFYEFM